MAVLGAVFGFAAWHWLSAPKPEGARLEPLSSRELEAELARANVQAGSLATLLAADTDLERFAEQAKGAADEPGAIAKALHARLVARRAAQAFVPWSMAEPLPVPPRPPAELLKLLAKDAGRAQLYPFELAVLEVVLLRAAGVPAMVAERLDSPTRRAPLDGSGYLGYFVVSVPTASGSLALDPYEGTTLSSSESVKPLEDPLVIGVALSLRALYESGYRGDSRAALASSGAALSLASRLPSVRSAHGVIVLGAKMLEPGLQELNAARQLRGDAARLHNLTSAALLTGNLEGAEQTLSKILETTPDFSGAHATWGALLMLRRKMDEARVELQKAESLTPDSSLVQWALAEYAMRSGDPEQALTRARRAIAIRPSFDGKLRLAVLLRQLGHYDEMRTLAHEIVDRAPDYRKEELRGLIAQALGPTALDASDLDLGADDLEDLRAAPSPPTPDLKLDSKPLEVAPARRSLRLGPDPSELHLKAP